MRYRSQGFTVIELIVVVLVIGVVAVIGIPRAVTSTPSRDVDRAARQLTRDLEQVRFRAIASKRKVRVSFDAQNDFYAAFLDLTPSRSGVILETEDEARASRLLMRGSQAGIPGVPLPKRVQFGVGGTSVGPLGDPISADPIELDGDQAEFDTRGMVTPAGYGGTIYLTHEGDPSVVAAVTISGAGAFQAWRYRDGKWTR